MYQRTGIEIIKHTSEYDQGILQSQTTDQPTALRRRDTEQKQSITIKARIHRESYMSAHILLNLLNEKRENARLAEHFISFSQRV